MMSRVRRRLRKTPTSTSTGTHFKARTITVENGAALIFSSHLSQTSRASTRHKRLAFSIIIHYLNDNDFRCTFCLSKTAFFALHLLLRPHLARDEKEASRSRSGVIKPSVLLAVTLRLFAAKRYSYQVLIFQIAPATVYVFLQNSRRHTDYVSNAGFSLGHFETLHGLAEGFNAFQPFPSPLHSCVGEIHNITIVVMKPPDQYSPRNFHSSMSEYALLVQ
eukprot:IDg16288t1